MDYKAFFKLNYGLQIIAAEFNGQKVGYIANTAFQVTSEPPKIAISAHKKNLSTEIIEKSGAFSMSVLKKELDTKIVGTFGFMSSSDLDKFDGLDVITAKTGSPIVLNESVAWFDCHIVDSLDVGSHILFIAEVVDSSIIADEEALTYAYYRDKYKMLAPKNAPTYVDKAKLEEVVVEEKEEEHSHSKEDMVRVGNKWICTICGYVYDPAEGDPSMGVEPGTSFEDLPEDYQCPICNAGKDFFKET